MTAGETIGRLHNPFRAAADRPMEAVEPPAPTAALAPASDGETATRVAPPLDLRPMTGFEEEFVERAQANANTAALCNEVLARCHVTLGEPVEGARGVVRALLVAERDAALVALRRISIGTHVETIARCSSCGHDNPVDFDLDELPLDIKEAPRWVEVELTDGTPVRMRLPTAGDQEDVLATGLSTLAERRSWLLARVMLAFGDHAGPFDTAFGQSLTIGQRRELEASLDAALPDLDLSLAASCEACDIEFAVPFDVAGFFLPR